MTDVKQEVTSEVKEANTGAPLEPPSRPGEVPSHARNTSPPQSSTASGKSSKKEKRKHPPAGIDHARLEALTKQLELEELLEQRKTLRTDEEKEKAWADAADMVKTYSDEMIDRWSKAIDTYLVFAGLFSAILTAFNVQSYPLLQPAPPDPVAILQQISLQLQSFSVSPTFVNSTATPAIPSTQGAADAPAAIPRSAIWLNILWFSGLILSLTSALMGILVKQWLNEYVSLGLSGSSREAAQLRQYRLNNLVKWRVGDIVIIIPILLLISLGLFLAGLLVLLWTLHQTVAIVASVLIGVVAVFTIGVTFLPLFKTGCAYLTPQTFAFYSLWRHVFYPLIRPAGYWLFSKPLDFIWWRVPGRFLPGFLNDALLSASLLFPKVWKTFSWHIHERYSVHKLGSALDLDILSKAYDCTLDGKAVSMAAVCLLDENPVVVLEYITRLHRTSQKHFQDRAGRYPKDALLLYQAFLCLLDRYTMTLFPGSFPDTGHLLRRAHYFLPSPEDDRFWRAQSPPGPKDAAWLRMAATWLTPYLLQLYGAHNADGTPDRLTSHCQILSWEGRAEKPKPDTPQAPHEDTEDPHLRTADDIALLHRDALMYFRTLKYVHRRDYKNHRTQWPSRPQLEQHCLLATRDSLRYSLRVLSSADPSAPADHHVIRTHIRALLFELTSFSWTMLPQHLRRWSHVQLDLLCDIVDDILPNLAALVPLFDGHPSRLAYGLRNLEKAAFQSLSRSPQSDIGRALDRLRDAVAKFFAIM